MQRGNGEVYGPPWLPLPEPEKTHLGQNEREAVRPEQSRPESTARLGLADKPEESCLQPGLQQDDAGVLGPAGVLDRGGIGCRCCHGCDGQVADVFWTATRKVV